MTFFAYRILGCLAITGSLTAGCSHEPQLYPVTGSITLDGQPLPEGDILFVSVDGARGPDPGKIKGGSYDLKTTAGEKRVEISAAKIRPGGARGAGGEPVPEEYLPARYNVESKLIVDVKPPRKPGQNNVINFDLSAK